MSRITGIVFSLILLLAFWACQEKPVEYREIVNMHPNGQESLVRQYSIEKGDTILKHETLYWENGKVRVEGSFDAEGLKDGVWTAWYDNGTKWSEGFFKAGKAEGEYKAWHENGQVFYEGKMNADERVGTWRFYTPDGQLNKEIKY
jgi:antitoxin component YwqK of YwqJK toxin-antitoxin module